MENYNSDFIVQTCKYKDFTAVVSCITTKNYKEILPDIIKTPIITEGKGKMIICQKQVIKNKKKKFVECSYDHGKIDDRTIKYVAKPPHDLREIMQA